MMFFRASCIIFSYYISIFLITVFPIRETFRCQTLKVMHLYTSCKVVKDGVFKEDGKPFYRRQM